MFLFMCKSKIHRATLTGKDPEYAGSIGVDADLLGAAGMLPGERVQVLNASNGERFETYIIREKKGSGKLVLYGPAARLAEVGDVMIVLSYCLMDPEEATRHTVRVVHVGAGNKLARKPVVT